MVFKVLNKFFRQIADSFPGMESISPAMVAQPPVQTHVDLRKAPKWLRKPAGSSFAVKYQLILRFLEI